MSFLSPGCCPTREHSRGRTSLPYQPRQGPSLDKPWSQYWENKEQDIYWLTHHCTGLLALLRGGSTTDMQTNSQTVLLFLVVGIILVLTWPRGCQHLRHLVFDSNYRHPGMRKWQLLILFTKLQFKNCHLSFLCRLCTLVPHRKKGFGFRIWGKKIIFEFGSKPCTCCPRYGHCKVQLASPVLELWWDLMSDLARKAL